MEDKAWLRRTNIYAEHGLHSHWLAPVPYQRRSLEELRDEDRGEYVGPFSIRTDNSSCAQMHSQGCRQQTETIQR